MEKQKRPNILLILTDQHRFDYLSCYGADFVRTPNIDRIAQMGMQFDNCFTGAPVCVPSRIALATGIRAHKLGSLHNQSSLPASIPTYYKQLRDNGYKVGCVGKLDLNKVDHFNGRKGDRPDTFGWGFTHPVEIEGKMHAGQFETPMGPYGFFLQEKGKYQEFQKDYRARLKLIKSTNIMDQFKGSILEAEDFADAYIGREAVHWMDENCEPEFPWHLFVSFVGPHDPFDPPKEYEDQFRDAKVPEPIPVITEGKPGWIKKKQKPYDEKEILFARRQYCATIKLIDDQVGEILRKLEAIGQLENTYIIFTSDHGEMLGDHGMFQKSVPYEASIHVPLLIAGPGIPRSSNSQALTEVFDINPTICDFANIPTQPSLDALSLFQILKGDETEHRDHIETRMHNFSCVRNARYKFVMNINDAYETYDLDKDPQELENIFGKDPELDRSLAIYVSTKGPLAMKLFGIE